MKKSKPKFLLIEATIFPCDILFSLADHQSICEYIEKKKKYKLNNDEIEKLKMNGRGRTVRFENGQVIMRLKTYKTKTGFDLADLTHEISHAVFMILDYIGVRPTNDDDEVYAYYSEYLMREILKVYDK